MHITRKAENTPYTPIEQSVFDAMVAAVQVRHESRKTL